MAVIKCKMCGGDLEIVAGSSVMECEYCGTQQTVPNADNEKKLTLFGRANRLRMACEFDKAAGVYESIVAEFPEEAEAYWGLVLCKYGIEYVDDPATGKKIPTCHRSSFDSVMDDSNLEQALENADVVARKVYREEAKAMEELRKGIIEVSGKEEPYDIFICYKETAENGDRTIDSVIAQDVYDALTEKGYRVFFSRITLEDKLGQEYEPYIFAALHSAKIMLAFGTDYEYYNAVWVKNEWNRFLQLIAAGEKKSLIPCFKGIDAYDMPKEFARLQAQDMGKVGAIQDLLRGIEKIIGGSKANSVSPSGASAGVGDAMVTRGNFALEDGNFVKADEYFDKALDQNPLNGAAYLGKVLAALHISDKSQINNRPVNIDTFKDFARAIQFSQGAEKTELESIYEEAQGNYLRTCLTAGLKNLLRRQEVEIALEKQKIELEKQKKQQEREYIYQTACRKMFIATQEETFQMLAETFRELGDYKESKQRMHKCLEEVNSARKILESKYAQAVAAMNSATTQGDYADVACQFLDLKNYKDAETLYKESVYCLATLLMRDSSLSSLKEAEEQLVEIKDYKNASELRHQCQERIAIAKREEQQRAERLAAQLAERRAKNVCLHCGGLFKKSLFSAKCSNCGKRKDY